MARTFTGLKLQGSIGKFGNEELSDVSGYTDLPDGKVDFAMLQLLYHFVHEYSCWTATCTWACLSSFMLQTNIPRHSQERDKKRPAL